MANSSSRQNKSVATKLFASFFASSDLEDVISEFNEILKVLEINPFHDDVFGILKVRRKKVNSGACMMLAQQT